MQITPPQAPILPNALQQQDAAKTVPQIQAQASTPVIQRAVDPAPKSDRGHQTRSNRDRTKGGDSAPQDSRGKSVNIRV